MRKILNKILVIVMILAVACFGFHVVLALADEQPPSRKDHQGKIILEP